MGNCCSYDPVVDTEGINRDHQVTRLLFDRMNLISFEDCGAIRSDEQALSGLKLVGRIGSGLFSNVYLARGWGSNSVWGNGFSLAVKVIQKGDFSKREAVQKMVVEKEILRILRHRNILRLFGTVQSDENVYFFLEFCPLGSLRRLVSIRGRLEVEEIRPIAAQIIEALCYIHSEGIIYGDLKAENVLLNARGELKLCDFNLSGTRVTLENKVQGTLSYISPEVIEGLPRNFKSDFWALGVLLYLLFYGKLPFSGHRGGPSSDLIRNIIEGNMPKEPKDRKAPPAFRSLISGLLSPIVSKRLGSKAQFESHPFFRGSDFDWQNFRESPGCFEYVRGMPPLQPKTSNFSPASKPCPKESRHPVFLIQNFTYETESPLTGISKFELQESLNQKEKLKAGLGLTDSEPN